MTTLEFKINIANTKKNVWETMLNPDTYQEWVNAAWPASFYEGTWAEGEEIKFIGANQSGTIALIEKCKPHDIILANHVAVLDKGVEIRDAAKAHDWIGTTEKYTFEGNAGNTTLHITIETHPTYEKMFADAWPISLNKLKEMCEPVLQQ